MIDFPARGKLHRRVVDDRVIFQPQFNQHTPSYE
jgi:hypothetical protein